jgi:hypothetical protein
MAKRVQLSNQKPTSELHGVEARTREKLGQQLMDHQVLEEQTRIMAKSWSGFLPQNDTVKQEWKLLEASRSEVLQALKEILQKQNFRFGSVYDEDWVDLRKDRTGR